MSYLCYMCLLFIVVSNTYILYIYEQHGECLIRDSNCLPFGSTWIHPRFFGGVLLCVFTFWVPCCDVRYDFRIKTTFGVQFGSSLALVVCSRAQDIICVCFRFCIVVSNTYCLVLCFLRLVVNFSGLSIFNWPFGIL